MGTPVVPVVGSRVVLPGEFAERVMRRRRLLLVQSSHDGRWGAVCTFHDGDLVADTGPKLDFEDATDALAAHWETEHGPLSRAPDPFIYACPEFGDVAFVPDKGGR